MAPRTADGLVQVALTQRGDRYVFGAEASPGNANPSAFDCSELVEWACARIGNRFVDGAENQRNHCRKAGTLMAVSEGVRTRGALLFRIGEGSNRGDHVAISMGNGQTIEARGRAYGVNVFSSYGRPWTHAGRVPGLPGYGAPPGAAISDTGTVAAAAVVPPKPKEPPPPDLKAIYNAIAGAMRSRLALGSRGTNVKILQSRLQHFGYWVPVTGVFDEYTKTVVQQFQTKTRKKADGQVGPLVWSRLFPEFVFSVYR